ncbi:type II secretion system F family protein [Candidatus Parcubacteria bacterium]|jgi:type IV pilus assembly protein PilC|nr:MAG: type II secretion system F family protein [Candidatus Parcubacteria bacterium]
MRLRYKAATKEGKIIQGLIDAKDVNEAAGYLRNKEFMVIKVDPVTSGSFSSILAKLNKVKSSDIVLFTRQLSSMLESGLTLMRALEIFRDQIQNKAMIEIVSSLITDVEGGKPLSRALSKFPDVFTPIYISLVKAGESSGLLDKVLLRLADNLEKQEKLKSTIKSALMYPIIVVILMIIVLFVMMIFVIPQLSALYKNLNIPLPLPTQIIVGMSNFVIVFWPLILIASVFLFLFFKRWKKTEQGQLIIDNIMLKIPVFGLLIKQTILTEFSRTFGLLVGTGTLVVDALLETADTMGNIYYKNAVKDISKQIEKGVSVGDAMQSNPLFPAMIVQLVKVGEQTGKVDENLLKASEYYEREVNQTVKTLTTAMEPFIMIVLGVGVGFLIISVITPIYSLISTIQ